MANEYKAWVVDRHTFEKVKLGEEFNGGEVVEGFQAHINGDLVLVTCHAEPALKLDLEPVKFLRSDAKADAYQLWVG